MDSKRRPSQLYSINKSSPGGMRKEVQTRVENERADVSSQTINHQTSYVLIFILDFERILMLSNAEPHLVIETVQVLGCRREQAVYHNTDIFPPKSPSCFRLRLSDSTRPPRPFHQPLAKRTKKPKRGFVLRYLLF